MRNGLLGAALFLGLGSATALEIGDVTINEVYFSPKGGGQGHHEAVELLVAKDKVDLNGITISDRDFWEKPTEDQCTLQDLGQGFLSSVRSGTLIVIYNGIGEDDTDPNDFVLRFYAKSSLYCNTAPTGNSFKFSNKGDNLHLFQFSKQLDFVKYRTSDLSTRGIADPGLLEWQGGASGYVDVALTGQSTGFRFLGNRADLNDYPAAWTPYSETYKENNNLGKPNGGVNTEWIRLLREKSLLGPNVIAGGMD